LRYTATVRGEPAARAPAADRDAERDRRIERRAVDARLASGDDLFQHSGNRALTPIFY